jgi:hypothetical protein
MRFMLKGIVYVTSSDIQSICSKRDNGWTSMTNYDN